MRSRAVEEAGHVLGLGRVAAEQTVGPEQDQVARLGDRRGGRLGRRVFIGQSRRRPIIQQAPQLAGIETGECQIAEALQVLEFQRQQLIVPFRPGRRTIGQQSERFDLRRGEIVPERHGHIGQPVHHLELSSSSAPDPLGRFARRRADRWGAHSSDRHCHVIGLVGGDLRP